MKTISVLSILTLLSGTIFAQAPFAMISIRSGSSIQGEPINANDQRFWLRRPTKSHCDRGITDCPAGNETLAFYGDGTVYMDVLVPGGQRVYISPKGGLRFTEAQSDFMPKGSIDTGFTFTNGTFDTVGMLHYPDGFYACPEAYNAEGYQTYQIFVGVKGFKRTDCLGIAIGTENMSGTGAFQYS